MRASPADSPEAGLDRVPVGTWIWVLVATALGVAFFAHTRIQRPIVGLGNHDVAGIAYNADVILRGGLPYVDTVELKSPGSFFLTAASFRLFGRSANVLLWTATALIGLAAAAVGVATHALYADEPARDRWRAVGLSQLLFWTGIAHFQANYTTWMMAPYAWCFALTVLALRAEDPRRQIALHVGVGLMAFLAYLMKAHAVVLGLCVPTMWLVARWRGWSGAVGLAWGCWVGGALLGALPLLGIYAAAGEVGALLDGVLPFGKASQYAQRERDAAWWYVPYRLVLHLDAKFPIQTSMMALAAAGVVARTLIVPDRDDAPARSSTRRDPPWIALAIAFAFLAWSLVGGGLGGLRYYRHYAPQYLPALAVLGAHPATWQWLVRWPRRGALDWASLAGAAGLIVLLGSNVVPYVGRGLQGKLTNGWHPSDDDQQIAAFIRENSAVDDTIFVWGWRGWSVYFFADRHAPTGMYKGLGTITEFNRNGLFRPSKDERDLELDFIPGPHADALLEAFETRPPAYIVRSKPFFPGMKNDPMRQFEPLHDLWKRDYVRVRRRGRLYLYEHRDHRRARFDALEQARSSEARTDLPR